MRADDGQAQAVLVIKRHGPVPPLDFLPQLPDPEGRLANADGVEQGRRHDPEKAEAIRTGPMAGWRKCQVAARARGPG